MHCHLRRLGIITPSLALLICGCSVPKLPSDSDDSKQNLTAGVVQREIRKGMTGGEVAAVLGSPNIVTSGPENTEVWVYDRTFSQVEAAGASTGVWFVVGTTGQSAGVRRSSQSTLTVVIKFDAEKRVADVAYHQSKF
jgi:outer membrane protein assembly factor BamE (lipoprotein component of BamABCDE complex)